MIEQERLGRLALYKLSNWDCERIAELPGMNNLSREGDVLPMLITRDWNDMKVK